MKVFEEDLIYISSELKRIGFRNKVFFITGATGLVGSVLGKAISFANEKYGLGNKVIAFVRNEAKAKRIFSGYQGIELCVGDVTKSIDYNGKIDFIIHAASETKSVQMIKSPVETLWTSLMGSKNVLDLASRKKIEKMVYLSSMEVFGNPKNVIGRVSEEQLGYIDIQNIRSCYPESKRMVENMCVCYAAEYMVPVVSARLAQTFGAGVAKEEKRVFAQFARSAMNGQNIVLHTTGDSYGNYVYTADAAVAIFTLLAKGNIGEVYTIANEKTSMSIKDMAEMVTEKIAGGSIKVIMDIPEKNLYGYAPDVVLKLDSSKMRSLGWSPMIDLDEAYRRLILYWGDCDDFSNSTCI